MVNSVQSQPNHYETLGVAPTASDDEISEAFERKMSECRWHPMGSAAGICIAYETLSNRFKRADYDRSHGLEPRPQPRLSTMTVNQQRWAPFIASMATNALGAAARGEGADPHVMARDGEMRAGLNPGAGTAAPVRELARPKSRGTSTFRRPRRQQPPRQQAKMELEPQLQRMLAAHLAERKSLRDSDDLLVEWKRPALAFGGVALAAVLVGAYAGLSLQGDESSAGAEQAASITAPARKLHANVAAQPVSSVPDTFETHSDRPLRSGMPAARSRHFVWRRHAPSWVQPAAASQPSESALPIPQPSPVAADQVAADPPVPQPN